MSESRIFGKCRADTAVAKQYVAGAEKAKTALIQPESDCSVVALRCDVALNGHVFKDKTEFEKIFTKFEINSKKN